MHTVHVVVYGVVCVRALCVVRCALCAVLHCALCVVCCALCFVFCVLCAVCCVVFSEGVWRDVHASVRVRVSSYFKSTYDSIVTNSPGVGRRRFSHVGGLTR